MMNFTCKSCGGVNDYRDYAPQLTAQPFSGVRCVLCGAGQGVAYTKVKSTNLRSVSEYRNTSVKVPIRKRATFLSCSHCDTYFEWNEDNTCPFCHYEIQIAGLEHRTIPSVNQNSKYVQTLLHIERQKAETMEMLDRMRDNLEINLSDKIKNNLSNIARLQVSLR